MFETLKPDEEEESSKCFNVVAVAIETISWASVRPTRLSHLVPSYSKGGPWGVSSEGEGTHQRSCEPILFCIVFSGKGVQK